jgi:hypothetical protein
MRPPFELFHAPSVPSFDAMPSIRFLFPLHSEYPLTIVIHAFSNIRRDLDSSWLGPLNYLRLWHDNAGKGNQASWFVKYVIVRDLRTLHKYHFICQRWLAVEKDDGKVGVGHLFACPVSEHSELD